MLESILSPFKAKNKAWEMFFIGFLYFNVAVLLSLWVFKEYSSVVVLFFTVIAVLPLIYNIIKLEEEESSKYSSGLKSLASHRKYFSIAMFLFAGIVVATALWYIFSPASLIRTLFDAQIKTISGISITGNVSQNFSIFILIFFNNLKVLIFCILFSFIYGSGAIFILTWNASVIGVAIGYYIRIKITMISSMTGFEYISHYFGAFAIGLTKYIIHGVPEILSYFIGGLAGGIISVGIIKREFKDYKFSRIIFDASNLIILAIIILVIAAVLEAYVTPRVFS